MGQAGADGMPLSSLLSWVLLRLSGFWSSACGRAATGGAAVCVLMYICFRLARMIAQPDHLIVRPNLGGSRNHGSAVGSTALGSPYRRRVSFRRLHCTMVRQRQNKL